jgi:hypothetical protein
MGMGFGLKGGGSEWVAHALSHGPHVHSRGPMLGFRGLGSQVGGAGMNEDGYSMGHDWGGLGTEDNFHDMPYTCRRTERSKV